MIVKKIDPEWKPDKKPDIKVGETIDVTDPKTLILEGKVIAVTEEGVEISAYELYGVITPDERKDFEEYLKVKKQKDLSKELKKENEELKTTAEAPKVETAPVVEPVIETKLIIEEKPVIEEPVRKSAAGRPPNPRPDKLTQL